MTKQHCSRCVLLEQENQQLRAEVRQLRERIRRIKRIIQRVMQATAGIDSEAGKRMAGGDLPRAAWSYLKATRATAQTLYRKIAQAYYMASMQ